MPDNNTDNSLHSMDHLDLDRTDKITENNKQATMITAEEVKNIVNKELMAFQKRVDDLSDNLQKLTAVCKESMDYSQRYQKHTVAVLQEENKQKDKYITGILLVDLIKPIAETCSKIERRIKKCNTDAEKKFLLDLLEEIEETAIEEYDVEIKRTAVGKPRPENISKVAEVKKTGDIQLKNTVAESLCASWTINGRVIQKERLIMYQYDPELAVVEEEENRLQDTENTVAPDQTEQSENTVESEVENVCEESVVSASDDGDCMVNNPDMPTDSSDAQEETIEIPENTAASDE